MLGAALQAQEQAAAAEDMRRAIDAQRADFDGRLADQAAAQEKTAAAVEDMQKTSAAMMEMMQGMMAQFTALSGIVQLVLPRSMGYLSVRGVKLRRFGFPCAGCVLAGVLAYSSGSLQDL